MKKNNLKNNIIIVLLVILALILFFVNISDMSSYYNLITGRATDTAFGSANITISAITQLNVSAGATNNTNISFGSGYVLDGYTFCAMSSQRTAFKSSGCSSSFASPGVNFTIQNVGNLNISINISSDSSAGTFIGGTDPVFDYIADQGSESGCKGVISNVTMWFAVNTSTTPICSLLSHVASEDTMQVAINISIPENSKTGALGARITFTGLSA